MNIIGGIFDNIRGLFSGADHMRREVERHKSGFSTRIFYVDGNCIWDIAGRKTGSQRYVIPKSVDQLFKVGKEYFLNGEEPVLVCYSGNPISIDFGKKPQPLSDQDKALLKSKNEKYKLAAETEPDENKAAMAAESISFADYDIPGAKELSNYCWSVFKTKDIQIIKPLENIKIVLLAIIFFLAGFSFAFVSAVVLFLGLTMTG